MDFNSQKGEYTLTYVTKSNNKKVKFQIYRFDDDFNFIDKVNDEVELEQVKTKYAWFNYKGEEYSKIGTYVQPNLIGTLILKKKRIT